MNPQEPILLRSARWLTFGSAAAIMLGIAPSQILLALSFAALLACGEKLRLPRIRLPLALFMLGTVISLLLSDDPVAGLPQIRKFYVFLELLVVFSLLRSLAMVRNLFLTWAGIGALTAVRGCIQFAGKVQEAHRLGRNFYEFYVGERITGFTSHWNTYSAEEMFALIMLASFLFFAPSARKRLWVWLLCGALIALAIVLGETRGIWIAVAGALLYLIWFLRRWMVALPSYRGSLWWVRRGESGLPWRPPSSTSSGFGGAGWSRLRPSCCWLRFSSRRLPSGTASLPSSSRRALIPINSAWSPGAPACGWSNAIPGSDSDPKARSCTSTNTCRPIFPARCPPGW